MSDHAVIEAFEQTLAEEKATELPDPMVTVRMPVSIAVQAYASLYTALKNSQDDLYADLKGRRLPSAYSRKVVDELRQAVQAFATHLTAGMSPERSNDPIEVTDE
jgi:hypothetical protein